MELSRRFQKQAIKKTNKTVYAFKWNIIQQRHGIASEYCSAVNWVLEEGSYDIRGDRKIVLVIKNGFRS